MALAKRPAAFNNGLDKKTDLPSHTSNPTWQPNPRMRPWSLLRRKRFLLTLLGICIVLLFLRYLPQDVPSVGLRTDPRTGRTQGFPLDHNSNSAISGIDPSVGQGHQQDLDQIYDGPIKFYHLAPTLRPHLQNYASRTDSVIFVLRDLRVISSLLPLACEMANYNRSLVHVAVMALQDNNIEEIMAVSGIKQTQCPVFWHDARPDYNIQSSIKRQANVLKAALSHLDAALKPSVVLIDQQQAKDRHFHNAIRETLNSLRVPLSVVPNDVMESMTWIASLTGRSIALLNQIRIDIAITPYKHSAGSLFRLLRSIENANYAGLVRPRIVIDLPQHVDRSALQYLEHFRWPYEDEAGQNKLILRRGIDASQVSPVRATLRTLESFYPAAWPLSHVLVLEPDVELSPEYLQYLMYVMLEYKYGMGGLNMTSAMMGISLYLPEKRLDDQSTFIEATGSPSDALLWSQSCSSTAMLYFGDKWVEIQDWLTQRLKHDPKLERKVTSSAMVSTNHPAWLNYAQELMLARNYYVLYPGFAETPDLKLVSVHDEVHQDPEEFAKDVEDKMEDRSKAILSISKDNILGGVQESQNTHNHVAGAPTMSLPALLLGKRGAQRRAPLPQDIDLPMYSSDGRKTNPETAIATAERFGDRISLEVGGCGSLDDRDKGLQDGLEYFFCERVQ